MQRYDCPVDPIPGLTLEFRRAKQAQERDDKKNLHHVKQDAERSEDCTNSPGAGTGAGPGAGAGTGATASVLITVNVPRLVAVQVTALPPVATLVVVVVFRSWPAVAL